MFSSGVMLAMNSASVGAEAIDDLPAQSGAVRADRAAQLRSRNAPRARDYLVVHLSRDIPTMREMFMGPRNILRMKEALLSLLAGDIFGATPIWASLRAFKLFYYAIAFMNLGRIARRRAAPREQYQARRA